LVLLIERDGACAELELIELLPLDTVPHPEASALKIPMAIKQRFNSASIRIAVLSMDLR